MIFIPGIIGSKTIILEEEEAVFKASNPCCKVETRRPYGELGSVDEGNCLCCVGVTSGLTKGQPVNPGWGCNAPYVMEIVKDMKQRMKTRGDTGNIQRAEKTYEEVRALRSDLHKVMDHLKIPHAPMSSPDETEPMLRY